MIRFVRGLGSHVARRGLRTFGILVLSVGIAGPGPAVAVSQDDALLADALRFRTEFGLNNDPNEVRAMADTTALSPEFGLPLTPDEESLMKRRLAIPRELDKVRAYRATHRDTWGGMWLTYPRARSEATSLQLNVGVTANRVLVAEDIKALVPADVDVAVVLVSHTQAQLDEALDAVSKDEGFFDELGTRYYSVSTILPDNAVEIELSNVTEAIKQAVSDRYGSDMTEIVEGTAPEADACSRTNCGPPWKGGIKIYFSATGACTSGFVVRKLVSGV